MHGFKYGFFDELLKLAATAQELTNASNKMRQNLGILNFSDIKPQSIDNFTNNDPTGTMRRMISDPTPKFVRMPLTQTDLKPEAQNQFGNKPILGATTSPEEIQNWVNTNANNAARASGNLPADLSSFEGSSALPEPKNQQNPIFELFTRFNDRASTIGHDKARANAAAATFHHETREGLGAKQSNKPQLPQMIQAGRDADAYMQNVDKQLRAGIDPQTGEIKYLPLVKFPENVTDTIKGVFGNQYTSHVSPMLPMEDLRIAHSMGRSSELAKQVNSDPALRAQVDAHQSGMGRENMLAKLKARQAGDPNWQNARATTGQGAELAAKLAPVGEPLIEIMRQANGGELSLAREFLGNTGNNKWMLDPKLDPYFSGDRPFAPWMKSAFERAWNNSRLEDRMKLNGNYLTELIENPGLRINDMALKIQQEIQNPNLTPVQRMMLRAKVSPKTIRSRRPLKTPPSL